LFGTGQGQHIAQGLLPLLQFYGIVDVAHKTSCSLDKKRGPQPLKSIGISDLHLKRKSSDTYNPARSFWKQKKADLPKLLCFRPVDLFNHGWTRMHTDVVRSHKIWHYE
jgi:hypothetical protein